MDTGKSDSDNAVQRTLSLKVAGKHAILFEIINESLCEMFSTRVREAFYDHLERKYLIAREELPGHLDQFSFSLRNNFGIAGRTIEKTIAKKFCAKIGRPFLETTDYCLASCLGYETASPILDQTDIGTRLSLKTPKSNEYGSNMAGHDFVYLNYLSGRRPKSGLCG